MLRFACLAMSVAAATAATPASSKDCKNAFDRAATELSSTQEEKCKALVTFSKCLGQFPQDDTMDQELFDRNTAACKPQWDAIGAPEMRTRRGNFDLTVDDAKDVYFHRHRRETINVFAMDKKLAEVTASLAGFTDELAKTKAALEQKVADEIKAMKEDAAKKIAAAKIETDTAVSGLQTSVASDISGMSTKVAANTKKINDDLGSVKVQVAANTKKIKDDLAPVKVQVGKLDVAVKAAAALAVKTGEERPLHMWSGGARNSRTGSSWKDFEYDRVDFDNAAPYFRKKSNTRFEALQTGFFKFDIDYISHANGNCWRYFNFMVAGQNVNGNSNHYDESWSLTTFTVTWLIKKGQEFWGKSYVAGCGNTYFWHGASTWKAAHNRLQITYMGQLSKVSKCTSNQGLC